MADLPPLLTEFSQIPSYLRRRLTFAVGETKRHQKMELGASSVMSIVGALIGGVTKASILAGVVSAGITFVGVLLLIFIFQFLRSPRYLYYEQANSLALLQGAAAAPEPLPKIDVKIIEVFIHPEPSLCFVHFSLHNNSLADCDLAPDVEAYSLSLKLKGIDKTYEGHRVANVLDHYYLSTFEDDVAYTEEGYEYEVTKEVDKEPLLSTRQTLSRGKPLYRWICFQLRGLPAWPYRDEPTGRSYEYPIIDDEGHFVDMEWVEDAERVLLTTNIETVTLTVIDPFNKPHSGSVIPPFCKYGRRVLRAKELAAQR
jgi:hypothetical protein